MNRVVHTSLGALFSLGLTVACSSTHPIPRELASARDAFNRATAGSGAELAPVQLHAAKIALDKAEKSFESSPTSQDTRDFSYIAQRKAQLAEAQAGLQLASHQRQQAEKNLLESQADATLRAQEELQRTRDQLTKAEFETKDALSKLTGMQDKVKQDERGVVITLSGNVLFAPGKSTLLLAARTQLDEIARALVGAKTQNITIEGYTDASGSPRKNSELSFERAEAVMTYLEQKGISSDRMHAIGRGESSPIASNKSPEGRATNRRVEIVVQGQAAASR